jgi:hypothetical protein
MTLREIVMNKQISAVMVWRSGVIGTPNAVRKYCANTIAFDALNLFKGHKALHETRGRGCTNDMRTAHIANVVGTRNLGLG